MIKHTNTKQVSINDFIQPFGGKLEKDNPWIKLALLMPWDEMASIYGKRLSKRMGRKSVDPRIAIGALIIKYMLKISDEDTIQFIKENPYLQYFLGYSQYSYEQPFTASLFVSIRSRLGEEQVKELGKIFMREVDLVNEKIDKMKAEKKSDQNIDEPPKNKGHLIVDATVAPSDVKFPTDVDLLNDAREKTEKLIDLLYVPEKGKVKPRTYRQNARKDYLAIAKQRKKRKSPLRKARRKQLGYVERNIKTIEKLLDEKGTKRFPLPYKYQKMYWVIQEVYRQQKRMHELKENKIDGRIVSISQPYIRPIVRGKAGKAVEFGAKLSISVVDGYSYLDKISWDNYNEGIDLISQIESYKERFGFYPEFVGADDIYGNRANRKYMKECGIKYTGKALGRKPKGLTEEQKKQSVIKKKMAKKRSEVEGVFGLAKRKYGLGLVMTKRSDTSENWIGMVYLIMNITHLLRVIFCTNFRKANILLKSKFEKLISETIHIVFADFLNFSILFK